MSRPSITPPRWPLKILKFFIRKEYHEEIEGDLEELFRDNLQKRSARTAKWIYAWEIVRLMRPVLLKNASRQTVVINQFPMFRNYFKVSIRSLGKSPLTSFINVFGLAVAIGVTLLVYTFMAFDKSIDQFHVKKNEVYLATFFTKRDGGVKQYGISPRPLADALSHDFPQIKSTCRVEDGRVVIKHGDNVFEEGIRYTDPSFLTMFTFPLKWGVVSSLHDHNSIILNEEMSIKYFGDQNPVGRELLLVFGDSVKKAFTVTGVAATFPKSRNLDFQFLINFENIKLSQPYDFHDWRSFLTATFIEADSATMVRSIESRMDKYIKLQNTANPDWTASSFAFEPLATLHARARHIDNAIIYDGNVEGRIGLPVIAVFMLLLASFNYINIAIVSAAKRLREIGVRKVVGANRLKVIVQFLTENVVITSFALIVGFALCYFIFIPWFVQFTGWQLELQLLTTDVWIFMIALAFITGFASGIYPALYVSSFDAVKIFKGSLRFGQRNPLTKVFLGIQLVLALITVTAAVVFTQNNKFQNTRSWGYAHENVLYVQVPDHQAFERMNGAMTANPDVLRTAGSADHFGRKVSHAVIHTEAHMQFNVNQFSVDGNYLKTMGLPVMQGRELRHDSETDKRMLLVNETFVRTLALHEPIGTTLYIDSASYEIAGVVKDFHHHSFFSHVEPTLIKLADDDDFRYLSLKVSEGSVKEVESMLREKWSALYPEIPFIGGQQRDAWASYFMQVDRSEQFNKVIASVAITLACLGLYGLIALNFAGRSKEFSIRKTLGAGVGNLLFVMSRQYAVLVVVALLIGAPVSYIFTKAYLNMLFAYPMPIGYSGLIISMIIVCLIVTTVVATQIRKLIKINPVEGLKTE
ncbi:MAG TPA: ABC transporter permease [Ohtaekwangia sp.]|nr:ABC transporter permease [Ohtaekwangia sp.]